MGAVFTLGDFQISCNSQITSPLTQGFAKVCFAGAEFMSSLYMTSKKPVWVREESRAAWQDCNVVEKMQTKETEKRV